MDRNKPGYMNFADIADRLENGKLNAYDVVYTKDTHEVVFIKEDQSLIRMKCRLDVYPSVVVAEYYLNLKTDTYVGQIVGIEQGEWIRLYNVNYADNKFIVKKVGVDEYGQLTNKPQINGVTLDGNKTTEQLGINIPTRFSQLYDDIGYVTFDHLIENYYSKSQTYSKSEVDTALAGKADTNDIPTDLADLQDDSTHRTVTDENITAWNGKSNVIANPSETTEALNSIEIDGVAYAIAGSGGGAVHSVNGKTGDVVLGASDVGALPDDTPLFSGDYDDLENKPTIPSALGDLTDDTYHRTVTDVEKTQWNAAEVNVQSDWNQSDNTKDDYIKNKPNIPASQIQSDWSQSDNTKADYIKNKPNIPDAQIQSDWNQTDGSSKDYIKNKPTLGTASALDVATSGNASANQVVKGNDSRLSDARTPVSHTHTTSEITDFPTLGTAAALDVATTGDASAQQVVRGNDSRLSDARTPVSHTHTLSEITDAGSAASKDSTSSVTAGSSDLVESGAVKTAIDNAISGAYKHAGTKTCAELISSLLIASNNGNVYNITDSGTTTADFIEGAGIPIRAGDNVGIAKVGDNTYKFDLLSGFIDTSNFVNKSSTSGLIKNDGSIDTTEYAPASSVPAAQIQSDWSQNDNTKLDYIKNKPTLGTAAAKNVPSSGDAGNSEVVLGNDTRLTDSRNAKDVYSWAKAENKPSYSKSEVGLGNVDNTSDTTKKSNFTGSIASGNAGFVTGGDVYSALGDKVDKVEGKGLSKNDYDDTAKGIVDGVTSALADKADKSEMSISTSGDQTTIQLKSGTSATVINAHQDISGKADKVLNATEGNFAGLDTNGNLVDSGHKHSDYLTEHQDISGKADKSEMSVTDGTGADADKTTIQLKSGTSATVLKTHQDISGKADKVSGATNGNLAGLDANGNLTDSGVAKSDIDEMQDELSTDYATVEGNPINFTTLSAQKSKSTILSVEPIQDLHGYDKPWVGGAGKNLLPMTVESIKANNTDETWSGNSYTTNGITYTILTDSDNNVIGINANGTASSTSGFAFYRNENGISNFVNMIINGCSNGSSSTYGIGFESKGIRQETSDFTITSEYQNSKSIYIRVLQGIQVTNVKFYPMIRLSTVSDATFEPYTNIASISGRSEVDILGCGKNIFNKDDLEVGGYKLPDHQYDSDITVIGTSFIKCNTGDVFTISGMKNWGSGYENCFTDKDKKYISTVGSRNQSGGFAENVTVIVPNNAKYLAIATYTSGSDEQYRDDYTIQVEHSENATDYSPCTKSNDLTISLGQTVYDGTLDVENGVLVVDRGYKSFDGTETWTILNYGHVATQISNMKSGTNQDGICSILETGNSSGQMQFGSGSNYIYIMNASGVYGIDTNEKAQAFTNGMQICYPLATPTTIQLTPNEISLLEGVNNISTDGDKITLTYRDGKFATLDGAVPKMTFRGEDYTMGVDDIGLFLKNLTKSTKTYIANPLLNFDGTVATYKKIMKQWFINNGVNIMDSTGITYLCERWYEITKQGWKGGTSFPAVGVSTGSTGTRFDDNVGMSVTPSTDTSANTDTYQGLPLFAIIDCNWELDSDGNILITAIDGITDNFVRDDPTKFVGVMQQTGWVKKVDDASTQKYYYADDKDAYEDLVPLPEAIKLDGTVRSFVVHAKYMSGIVDSKMTCCSGIIPRRNISHDSLVTLPDNIGTQYSGGTSVDWSFLVWMQRIKYASLTSDGVLQGCCNYNYQYYVKVSETGVKRLILSSANGANLKVGSTVTFGAYAGNADRGQAATYSISGQDGAIITAIEDVTIDSTTYKAIYVDTTSTFDTVANGDATNGTTIVSTHHWVSGSCDNVKGNDGSPVSATNGVYPAKLQGIEYMVGGYEVFADVIMNISGGYYNPYYARKSTDQATSITSSMVQSTLKCAQPSSDAWRYIQKHGFDGEIFYPVSTGTSSSEYMKDGFYENGTGTTTGTREWLAFGNLGNGSGGAGLSYLNGSGGLAYGGWSFLARLSPNGNRGELAA